MSNGQASYGWRMAGFLVTTLLLLMLFIYHQTVLSLIWQWNDLEHGEYGHGYLILAVSIYLIWDKRQALSQQHPSPSYLALLVMLAVGLLWVVAVLVDVLLLQSVVLLLLILVIVWSMLGRQVTGMLLFPILFIGFAIPIWFPLTPVLQDLSADVVFRGIRILGIPAFRQDNEIVLPAGTLSITEACSGMRYFLPGLALGALYGYLNYTTFRDRFIVFWVAATAAILVNIVRVFIVVYVGYTTDMQHPFIHDHLALGWYLFGGMMVILLGIDFLLYRHRSQPDPVNIKANTYKPSPHCGTGKLQQLSIFVASAVLLSAGPAVACWIHHQPILEQTQAEFKLPSVNRGWVGPRDSDNDWMPEYRGAISQKQAYQKEDKRIDFYMGYYLMQKQGEELIYYGNRIGNKDVWNSRTPNGKLWQSSDRRVLEQLLEKDGDEQRLVWYWYRVAGFDTANRYQAKALQVLGVLMGNTQAYIMAISVSSDGDIIDDRKVLGEFLSVMENPLAKLIEQHRQD